MKKICILLVVGFWCLIQADSTWCKEKYLEVLYLDGRSGYVILPGQLTHGLQDATIEAWVRWESFPKWARVFDFGTRGNAAVVQNEKASSTLNFAIYDRESKRYRIQKSKAVTKRVWYHIAAVCGSEGMVFYINGESVGATGKYRGGLAEVSGGNNYIGKSNWENDELFHGFVTEFRIWRGARTQQEIRETMTSQLLGNESNLIGYWRFTKMDGSVVKDLSGHGNHAVVIGAAAIHTQESPPIALKMPLLEIKAIAGIGAYRAMLLDAYQNGNIDGEEKHILDSAQQSRNLPPEAVLHMEMDVLQSLLAGPLDDSESIYFSILERTYADKVISSNEKKILEATKFRLGLSDERAKILMGAFHLSKSPE